MKEKHQGNLRFFNFFSPLLFLLVTTVIPTKGQLVDKIVAKVDNQILLKSELDVAYLQYLSQAPPEQTQNQQELRCMMLESLLINKLLLAKAEIDSVTVDYETVSSQLEQRMDYFIKMAGSVEKLEQTYKKSIDELKDDLRKSLQEQLITQKMQETITGAVKVTPGEVKKFYNSIPEDSLPYFSTLVEVGHIVKKPEIGRAEKAHARELLIGIREQIQQGADFCKLAERHSQDPGSKKYCGELGFFKKGELVPEYEAAALNLKPGEFSGVVESEYGFHLIQMIERRSNEFNTRHILIKAESNSKDFNQASEFLDSIRTLIQNDSIAFSKAANQFSQDKQTQSTGGFMTDEEGSYRISVEDLEPVLFFTIDSMKVGDISNPVLYKMEDGTEAMRIVFLKSKTAPHKANLKEDYQEIYNAALGDKKNRIMNEWFDKTKDEVYIKIDQEYSDCNILMNP